MNTTQRRTYCNPFYLIFSCLYNLIIWLFKLRTSALELTNNTLRDQLESLSTATEQEICSNAELEKANSTLNESISTLQTEVSKIKTVLERQEHQVRESDKEIIEQSERAGAFEKEIYEIEMKKEELDARVKEQKELMESESAEWISRVEKENERKVSLEEKLNKQSELKEKHLWMLIAWETGLEHSQNVIARVKCAQEKLKETCTKMEEEHLQLKEISERLGSEKRD